MQMTLFTDENRKIATALTFFKIGMPAGEWAQDKQKTAMAATSVDFGSWADFRTAFEKHFIPAQSQLELTKIMYNLKIGTCDFNFWYQEWSCMQNVLVSTKIHRCSRSGTTSPRVCIRRY